MSSTVQLTKADLGTPPIVQLIQQRSLIVGAVFAVLSLVGAFLNTEEFYRAYLLAYLDWLGIALGSMALLMLTHMTGGTWAQAVRRVFEAATRTFPVMAVLFIPLPFGIKRLYIWARADEVAHNKHLQEITHSYLNIPAFVTRAFIYFAIWLALAYFLSRWSAEQDLPSAPKSNLRFRILSGPGMVLYAFTITFASIDWVMSLDPSWISTIYGLLFLAGQLLSALAFVVVVAGILAKYRPASEFLKPDYIHDYGKLLLALVMVWAYFGFSQWLIIWAGNLPEEISWYLRRLHGGWQYFGLSLALFYFAFPFLFLLSRSFKRRVSSLMWLAAWLLFMRFVDLYWLIEPNFYNTVHIGWLHIVLSFAIGGLWLAMFCRNLRERPLLPLYDVNTRAVLESAHHG